MIDLPNHQTSEDVWLQLWSKTRYNAIPLWDELSELVYFLLRLFISTLRNKVIIEAGSATGRISLRLAKHGGRIILLDISRNAIMYSKKWHVK
jgi:2-polyprenyl-3-methyl-5-hydroxy-6-metoxy-1,4-benzoquinol methylase